MKRLRCRLFGHRSTPVVQRVPIQVRGQRKSKLLAVIVDWRCARCRATTDAGVVFEERD